MISYDTKQLQDVLLASAFVPMTVALSMPGLKLKAYQAFEAAQALHGDERCVLLGETLLKDVTHSDPQIRLAAVGAYFLLLPHGHEDLRCRAINIVLAQDEDPAVRRRALQGIAELARTARLATTETAVEKAPEASISVVSERLAELRKSYAEALANVTASSPEAPLAFRALAELRQELPLE